MKFRGKREDVIKALNKVGMTQVEEDEDAEFLADGMVWLPFARAYVDDGVHVYLDYREVAIGVIDRVNFAWGIREDFAENMKTFAKENDIEIKFYGYEQGIEFEQEYYTDGRIMILNTTKYKDWLWESRHPTLGG